LPKIKTPIDAGKGIGERTILNITNARRRLHAKEEDKDDGKVNGLKAIREAVATLSE